MRSLSGMRRTQLLLMSAVLRRRAVVFYYHNSGNKKVEMLCNAMHGGVRGVVFISSKSLLTSAKHITLEQTEPTLMQLRCPECGKRFLSEVNLRQHRRSRHFVTLKSPYQERLDRLKETNARLLSELRALQDVNALRLRSVSSSVSTSLGGPFALENTRGEGYFPAAVPESRTVNMSTAQVRVLRDHPFRLGTGTSEIRCVGVVEDDVELGFIGAKSEGEGGGPVGGLETMQFTLRTEGYRQRRVGQLKMYCNRLIVRVVAPRYRIEKGDVLLVLGTYGLHKSYDIVSKQMVENAVVEAGYVGLLQRGKQ